MPSSGSVPSFNDKSKKKKPILCPLFFSVRKHFINRMPAKLAQECEGDESDVKINKDDDPVEAMERLNVDEEEEAGVHAPSPPKKKKKRKQKKPKKTVLVL